MRLHLFTLDEREAMRFRKEGWKFKQMDGSLWELTWSHKHWPEDVRQQEPKSYMATYGLPDPNEKGLDDHDPR